MSNYDAFGTSCIFTNFFMYISKYVVVFFLLAFHDRYDDDNCVAIFLTTFTEFIHPNDATIPKSEFSFQNVQTDDPK